MDKAKMGLQTRESDELKKVVAKELSTNDPTNAEKILASYYKADPTKEGATKEEQDCGSERNDGK